MFAIILATMLAGGSLAQPGPAGPSPATPQLAAAFTTTATADRGSDLLRAPDGLFYVTGTVNGVPVRFLVDTGASTVVLTSADAMRAGVVPGSTDYEATADTANGRARMAWVGIDSLQVAGTNMRTVSAAVVPDGLTVSLLGQNWLSRLASMTITGDRMLVR